MKKIDSIEFEDISIFNKQFSNTKNTEVKKNKIDKSSRINTLDMDRITKDINSMNNTLKKFEELNGKICESSYLLSEYYDNIKKNNNELITKLKTYNEKIIKSINQRFNKLEKKIDKLIDRK